MVTRNVPCQNRVDDMEEDLAKALNQQGACDDEDAEWLVSTIGGATSNNNNNNAIEDDFDILDEDGEVVQPDPPIVEEVPPAETETTNTPAADTTTDTPPITSNNDDDGYADMADFEDDNVLMDDDNVAAAAPSSGDHEHTTNSNTLQVRTYDLSITYDKYYQTPRVWMVGTSAQGQPLTAEEMMQDVMADYAHKTVTIENHPHVAGPHASIHPCQHGKVMKRIVQNLIKNSTSSGQAEQDDPPTVELYLFIFLKFVNSIIPTINYDFTMDVTASTQK